MLNTVNVVQQCLQTSIIVKMQVLVDIQISYYMDHTWLL